MPSLNIHQAPTINEIVYQRQDRLHNIHEQRSCYRFEKFRKGDKVAFTFSGRTKYGRITNVHHYGPMVLYSIETYNGSWYREIEEPDIKHLTEAL